MYTSIKGQQRRAVFSEVNSFFYDRIYYVVDHIQFATSGTCCDKAPKEASAMKHKQLRRLVTNPVSLSTSCTKSIVCNCSLIAMNRKLRV